MLTVTLVMLPIAEYYPGRNIQTNLSTAGFDLFTLCMPYEVKKKKYGPARKKKRKQWSMHKKAIGLDTSALVKSRMENIKSLQRDKWEKVFEMRGKTKENRFDEKKK